jgi:hypothetical protein
VTGRVETCDNPTFATCPRITTVQQRVHIRYPLRVSEPVTANVVAFYLFDTAESANLKLVSAEVRGATMAARLAPKPATPAYVQYGNPPLSFDGDAVGATEVDGFRMRVRVYEYGVISVAFTRVFVGSWSELVALGQVLIENDELEQHAERTCRLVVGRLGPALHGQRETFLSEDYIVFAVTALDAAPSAEALLAERGHDIAQLLCGERQPLSAEERARILDHRISYLADDLVVPTWNAAFVYDTEAGMQAALEILEFANSQLLEYRHHDQRLDAELELIYAEIQKPRWYDQWIGSRYTRAARQVHALFIDVTELTDRTENTLKFIGDIYAARLFALVAGRLGLERWKADVEGKLKTLDDIYRFAVEQTSMARGTFLELTVVLILVLELVLLLLGIMK